jgi:hypothetical protein
MAAISQIMTSRGAAKCHHVTVANSHTLTIKMVSFARTPWIQGVKWNVECDWVSWPLCCKDKK